MNINRIPYNKVNKKRKAKIIIRILLFIFICFSTFYGFYKYNKLIDSFKTSFDNYKFSQANNILLTQQKFNPFKVFMMDNDISKYFSYKLNSLTEDINNQKISSENALIQIKEIQRYNIIDNNKLHSISDSIDLIKESTNNYNTAIDHFNNGQYSESIPYFNKVSALDLNYIDSLIYLNDAKSKFKESLFADCDNLVSSDYYSEALSKISDNNNIFGNDSDVKEKIIDIKEKQQDYLDKNSAIAEASSRALTNSISPKNINTLNIESITSYFVNVNLKEQKTYVYKGKADKWQLIKTFPCSTGVNGEDTPSGSFSIKEKGDWFFSDKYEQGGKYWSQITGDILFHSVPFAKNKTTVLDYTMNKPSSHGCIRLSLDDAKWIYTNIPKGSKVIIK
ncbi:L,D-transpeptidase family protein [Clostridium chromiireducens]|uniref:L,D-transpeptidase family protein n=1 Tax=Clostridium chromiireducens TaxID=225345 RepID=A0A964W543_9CLOT|nr:L,D-transpeptidase [Clostridium chromiireducens]MVX67176.1 L,D-transpeptidase family protein [Clostridium chromiireducens]